MSKNNVALGLADGPRWIFRADRLAPGDIVATRTPGSLISGAIRLATGHDFSHVLIVVRPPIAVESGDFGVVRLSLDRHAILDKNNVRVFRYRDGSLVREKLLAAAGFAEGQVTREYADEDMLTSLLPIVPSVNKGQWFCSQLVSASYESAELPLVDRQSSKVTPGDIVKSASLEDVTDSCLDEIDVERLDVFGGTFGFLDGPSSQSVHFEEVQIKQAIVQNMKATFKQAGVELETYSHGLSLLAKAAREQSDWYRDVDAEFAERIRGSGLLQLVRKWFSPDAHVLFYDLAALRWAAGEERSQVEERLSTAKRVLTDRSLAVTSFAPEIELKRNLWVVTDSEALRLDLAFLYEVYNLEVRLQNVAALQVQHLHWVLTLQE
ncbi:MULTISPECIES: hypothetical protein [unclassified Bradyrhizobium]|uniref:hypothetical protein n=1 Tax=unclassified Bradyrhizobium TaxID=2631580 RepID=UPI001FF976B1|nr:MULTISPECIES: hypothetical protein [unclassified Bradyrhizobium]MCK1309979.1 hypothetical protein [Bradyrhizobium sp. 45]MCK1433865.1 hypothetical protein [Bradyrhizobium sp. 15]MCK1614989.1 hypothetical protein [Bradyrhizobium sp. 163]MCK1764768.1 hypothetical protein [Bradyrhizobium sp. 136]